MSVVCLFCMCIRMLVQSISVFLLAAFLWALLPEIKWMMMIILTLTPTPCTNANRNNPNSNPTIFSLYPIS